MLRNQRIGFSTISFSISLISILTNSLAATAGGECFQGQGCQQKQQQQCSWPKQGQGQCQNQGNWGKKSEGAKQAGLGNTNNAQCQQKQAWGSAGGSYPMKDGGTLVVDSDGTKHFNSADGSQKIMRPDGSGLWRKADGSQMEKFADGRTVCRSADGKEQHQ